MSKKAVAAELRRLTAELRSLEKEVAEKEAKRPIEVVFRIIPPGPKKG